MGTNNVYVFETKTMRERCSKGSFKERSAYQGTIETAKGYIVPIKDVSDLIVVPIPEHIKAAYAWPPAMRTGLGAMGKKAETLVRAMFEYDLIHLPRKTVVEDRVLAQYRGIDLVHSSEDVHYQVKCDIGVEKYNNLYIQTHECNPYKEY